MLCYPPLARIIHENHMKRLPLVLLVALVGYALPFFASDELISPDDAVFAVFSGHLARTGRLAYRPEGDAVFGIRGFVPRYFVYSRSRSRPDDTFPRKFPGFIFVWGGLRAFAPWPVSRLVNPFLAVLALLLLYAIGRTVYPGGKEALWGTVILAVNPLFIHRAYMYNATLCNLVFFLASLLFLLLALRRGSLRAWLLFGAAAGAFLWIRPTNPVYLAALAGLLFFERGAVRRRGLLLALGVIALFALGILFYNKACFGSYLSLGYTVTHVPPEKVMGVKAPLSVAQLADYLRFHPAIWLLHLKNAPLALALGFPLLPLAAVGLFLPGPGGREKGFRNFFLCQILISAAFFANFGTFGYEKGEFTLHSSFLRYLTPTVALLSLFAARALARISHPTSRPLVVACLFSLLVAFLAPSGEIETVLQSLYYRACRGFLLQEVPENGVLFSHYWDKSVFPERIIHTGGSHFPGESFEVALRRVLETGRPVFTTSHFNDEKILVFLQENFACEEIRGPPAMSPLLRAAARFMPSDIYPLVLYRVTGPLVPEPAASAEPSSPLPAENFPTSVWEEDE